VLIKVVLFDLYLTLVDLSKVDEEEINRISFQIIKREGFNIEYEKFKQVLTEVYNKWRNFRYENLIEVNPRVWWSETLIKLNIRPRMKLIEEILNSRHQYFRSKLEVYPDALQCLQRLRDLGLTLGLVSNSSDSGFVRDDIRFLGLDKFFDLIIISADLGLRKPTLTLFKEILGILSVKPNEVIFVGDDLVADINGAKSAGMYTVYIDRMKKDNPINIKADLIVDNLTCLAEEITKII